MTLRPRREGPAPQYPSRRGQRARRKAASFAGSVAAAVAFGALPACGPTQHEPRMGGDVQPVQHDEDCDHGHGDGHGHHGHDGHHQGQGDGGGGDGHYDATPGASKHERGGGAR